jgi:transcription antitermination factor NusG
MLSQIIPKTPGAVELIDEVKVPTRMAGDSRGAKSFTTAKVIYPSYIFVKMRLTSVSYKAILACNRVSSFVGTRKPIG